jgi:predicted nucleotidyltransferase
MSETVALPWNDASGEALNALRNVLAATPGLAFAVLVGSRANNSARSDSDWDIALQWHIATPWMQMLGDQETLRRQIAETLGVPAERIDLIDLPRANLAFR